MSPRPYHLGKRQDQIDATRHRVLTAARALLAEATSYAAFTMEAVATRADVARATVYYQFASKAALLEALCDALADEGQMSSLATAFMQPDPIEALHLFIACFGRFWDADRFVMRRLRALAVLDAEVGAVIAGRDARRRSGLEVLIARLGADARLTLERELAVRMLYTLTSFETFDALAAADEPLIAVTPTVLALATVVWRPTALDER